MTGVDVDAWRTLPAAQQPDWDDAAELDRTLATLRSLPPLVLPSECDTLRHRLAAVARGEAFLLQGGDCAETFAALTRDNVRDKVKTLLQMAIVLTYGPASRSSRWAASPGSTQSRARRVESCPASTARSSCRRTAATR